MAGRYRAEERPRSWLPTGTAAAGRRRAYRITMCRNIKPLRPLGAALTAADVEAAARQYVRKVSGIRAPSSRTTVAFETAVADVAAATARLLEALGTPPAGRG
ncbi:MAG: hypothetical protein KatS3mg065_0061 [Chloroflexota bacterium]|nr:MAG: hypothetical protein KatS3mg065_0061 [Chloroflexota bacterium]